MTVVIPSKWRGHPHHPLPLAGTNPTGGPVIGGHATHAVLPCVCGWRSVARPFTSEPIPLLLAEHALHAQAGAPSPLGRPGLGSP